MKQFNSLLDAIHFNTHCPLCQSELRCDSLTNSNQKVALQFLSKDNIVYIDIATHDMEIVNEEGQQQPLNNGGSLGQSITVSCYDCYMYSFIIQIWINLNKLSIDKVVLNSEDVSWEDENCVLHEITSIYSTNHTKYSYYNKDAQIDDGQIVLPFINFDISNPKEAVARIRKLIVFS